MGDPKDWPQLSGLLPEGSSLLKLPSVDNEKWAWAELRISELIDCIQPTKSSEKRRRAVVEYVQQLICKHFDCQVFTFGSVPLKTYLPDGDIDLTAFSKHQCFNETWAGDVRSLFEEEEHRYDTEFQVRDVQYIHAEVKIVKCLVGNIVVDISFNQLGGLCTLCFLEEVDRLIGQRHLFKRSIILIKAWCYYESRILGAHHGLISTYALETLVLYIFHVFHGSLRGPLEVLFRFLDFFSNFDWDKYCVSLWGPVPLANLPDLTAEPPRKDAGELLLNKEFLDSCSQAYAVFPGGQDGQGRSFSSKHLNVIDPLRTSNNLGRSVSKGNFFRIRSAFGYGARKLARILECPKEKLNTELDHFFQNTWDRYGSRRRPDVPVPVNQTQQRLMLGRPLSNSIVSPKYKIERTSEPRADAAEVNGIHELSSSSLSAEAEVLSSALQHLTKTIREGTTAREDSNKATKSPVASILSKGTKHEFGHGKELLTTRADDFYPGKENATQMDEPLLQRGSRTQSEESSKMEQIAISPGSRREGNSDCTGNIEQSSLKVPLARSTRSGSRFAVTGEVLASAGSTICTVPAGRLVEASLNPLMKKEAEEEGKKETFHSKGPLITISAEPSKNEDVARFESKDPSSPFHHEVMESDSRTDSDKFCSALPTGFAHISSVIQQNKSSLHLQSSVDLPLSHQENLVCPPALGVSSGHTNTSLSMPISSGLGSGPGVTSYVSSLPRGPVPPPLPPYMGFVGIPSPHLVPTSEDPIVLSNQFPSLLPRMDEALQQQDHNLYPKTEQVHKLHGVHLVSSTPNATHAAASLVHTLPQLVVSEAFSSPTAISPVSSLPGPASLNSPTFYLNNSTSFRENSTEIEDTTAGRHICPLENAEENITTPVQERIETGSFNIKRGTESEVDAVGRASDRLFRASNDEAFSRGKEVSNVEVSEFARGDDGYVFSYEEEPMYFPTQTGYGHTILSFPGYPYVFPSAGSVSGPMLYPNAVQPTFSQTNIYSGTSLAATSPVLVPYPPFSSQVAAVSSVSAIPAQRQHSSLFGVSATGPEKSLRPSGSEQTAPAVSLFRSQRSMDTPGTAPSSYLQVPYIAVHNSLPVYVSSPNFDGTPGLDMSDSLQSNNSLGVANEFGAGIFDETQMQLNPQLTYGVGERLLSSGVAVSAGSQLQDFPLDGHFEAPLQDSRFDPLSTDFAGHLRNLDYGRVCQNPQVLIPVLNQPPILHPSPKYIQGHYPWEGPGRPLQSTINLSGQAVRSGHVYVPVTSVVLNSGHNTGGYHIVSGIASPSGEDPQRTRSGAGTGAYWSTPREPFSRNTQPSGRNISGANSQYHGERNGGQIFAPRHRINGRTHTRSEGRSSSYMTNENTISEERVTQRVRLMPAQDSSGISSMQPYPGVRVSSASAVPAGTVLTPINLEMLPQIYINNNAIPGAASPNVPPVLVVYPYVNGMELSSESSEFSSLGMLHPAAPQADIEQEGHVIGRGHKNQHI